MKVNQLEGSEYYKEALLILNSKVMDVEKAKELLFKAMEEGDPFAAYALGTWYFFGSNGIRKNIKKAVLLWHIAAKAKVPDALFDLAVYYEVNTVNRNLKKSFLLYVEAAIRGDKEAVFAVGRCYFYGIGISKNKTLAEVWFLRAEELGTYSSE